jgi:hypothetical protein
MMTVALSGTVSATGWTGVPTMPVWRRLWPRRSCDCRPHRRRVMALSQPPARSPQRRPLTAGRLDLLRASLTGREHQLLGELGRLQVATTEQLARLVFGETRAETATRLARRHLQWLTHRGLAELGPAKPVRSSQVRVVRRRFGRAG